MGQFITPDVLPEDTFCRVLLIPNDPKWIGAVSGALLPMIYASEWEQWEGITPDEAANRSQLMLEQFWNSNGCETVMSKCCEPLISKTRLDPETGRPQVSYDGGETWQGDPDDVENQITLLQPPVRSGSPSTKCDAATNAAEHIDELITATGENLTTASTVFALAVGIAEAILALVLIIVSAGTLTAPVTAVATAIWVAATQLFALGIDGYNAYWTTDKQDAIFCAIYCNIGENGQFTEAQYQAFRAKVKAQLPSSPALDIVMTAINAAGATGLSQMASYGTAATRDCDSCDCEITCETDAWSIVTYNGQDVGEILSVGENYIIVQGSAHPDFGTPWNAMIKTTADDVCCELISVEQLTGDTDDFGRFGVKCGNPRWPGSANGFVIDSDNLNTVFVRKDSGSNFTAKITFG